MKRATAARGRAEHSSSENRDTSTKLLSAAMAEFNERGFGGTDTNRIARRAGYAPQTFYRWYTDKTQVFIQAYRWWHDEETALIRRLVEEHASDARLVEAGTAHHRDYLRFRRSLRSLSLEDDNVRAARAQGRLKQIRQIKTFRGVTVREESDIAVTLLQVERLMDALAEGEISDMGLSEAAARRQLAGLIRHLRGSA